MTRHPEPYATLCFTRGKLLRREEILGMSIEAYFLALHLDRPKAAHTHTDHDRQRTAEWIQSTKFLIETLDSGKNLSIRVNYDRLFAIWVRIE